MPSAQHSPKDIWDLAMQVVPAEEIARMSPQRERTLLTLCAEELDVRPKATPERLVGLREMLGHLWPEEMESLAQASQSLKASRTSGSATSD